MAKTLKRAWTADFIMRLLSRRKEVPAPPKSKLKTPCWLWTGHCEDQGYGQVRYLGKVCWVHRVSYTLFRGVIPAGREIGHKCRVRGCWNPEHLKYTQVPVNRRDIVRAEKVVEEVAPF